MKRKQSNLRQQEVLISRRLEVKNTKKGDTEEDRKTLSGCEYRKWGGVPSPRGANTRTGE